MDGTKALHVCKVSTKEKMKAEMRAAIASMRESEAKVAEKAREEASRAVSAAEQAQKGMTRLYWNWSGSWIARDGGGMGSAG
jgi:hypothetical protein